MSNSSFKVLIEIPQGSNQKFEFDEASGKMKLNFVFKDLVFPFNYGFIPNTLGGDNDPLDAIVLSSTPLRSGEAVECKALGVFKTIDRGEVDDKIIFVLNGDPLEHGYKDVSDLPSGTLQKWTEFYLEVARQKEKKIEILGFRNKEEALEELKKSLV